MTSSTYTPTSNMAFNEFDRQGLLLGLDRLTDERNAAYKQRLLDVFVNRADSTYRGLINGITRELGYSISDAMTISTLKDSDGNPLLSNPAVVFEETKCILYSDFIEEDILLTLDRYEYDGGVFTLQHLADIINSTGYFVATVHAAATDRSMTIFNQSSVNIIPSEELSGYGSTIILENTNLITGTISVQSPNLIRRVTSIDYLREPGDYTIKLKEGQLVAFATPAPGSIIRYAYREDDFLVKSSPVIIHKLQSDDFKTKMFKQFTNEDNETFNGTPTVLGAELINELQSIFPTGFGI